MMEAEIFDINNSSTDKIEKHIEEGDRGILDLPIT